MLRVGLLEGMSLRAGRCGVVTYSASRELGCEGIFVVKRLGEGPDIKIFASNRMSNA